MNPFSLFKTISRGNSYWRTKNAATLIIISCFGLLALMIAFGEYTGFRYFLKTLQESPEFKTVVISYSLHSLYAVIFALMIASCLILSPILFLKNNQDNFLLSLPIKTTSTFTARLISQIAMISWTAILFGLPATLAIGIDTHQSIIFYLLALIFLILTIILTVSLSNILLFLIVALTRSTTTKLISLFSLLSVGLILYALISTVTPHNLETLLAGQTTNQNTEALKDLTKQFQYWPSTLYAESIISPIIGKSLINLNSLYLILITSLALIIQFFIAKLTYRRSQQMTQENNEKTSHKKATLSKMNGYRLYFFKELFLIFREKSDRNQFFLFVFLFMIYVGFISNSPNLTSEPDPIWTPRIIFFILTTISYFTVLLALRFTFPFGSTEKHKNWFDLTLPLVRCRSFCAHIVSTFLPIAIIIETIILLTARALHYSSAFTTPLLLITPILCLTNIVLASSLGVMMPVKHNTSPESMSTTPSGLLAFLVCLTYSTAITSIIWLEAKNMIINGQIGINIGSYYSIAILLSLLLIILFWYYGKKSYKKLNLN